jgi:hypothetical protein
MNMPFAASFIRAAVQQVTAGALPTRSADEWAIYQHDLEITRNLARVHATTSKHTNQEIRRLEASQICNCQTETRTA